MSAGGSAATGDQVQGKISWGFLPDPHPRRPVLHRALRSTEHRLSAASWWCLEIVSAFFHDSVLRRCLKHVLLSNYPSTSFPVDPPPCSPRSPFCLSPDPWPPLNPTEVKSARAGRPAPGERPAGSCSWPCSCAVAGARRLKEGFLSHAELWSSIDWVGAHA